MAFENMTTWLVSFGYIFVIVIAGSALFVGTVKKKNKAKEKLKIQQRAEEIKNQTKPDQVADEVNKTDDKTESDN